MYQLISELHFRNYLLGIYEDGFSAVALYDRKLAYKKPDIVIKAYSGSTDKIPAGILYPELYLALKNMRDKLAIEKNTPVFMVCSSESLEQMVQLLPQDKNQLLLISGMGSSRIAQFGKQFIEIIQRYCAEHALNPSAISASIKTKKKKTAKPQKDTKQETLILYKSGMTLQQIASSRNLSVSTIETHLAAFIEKGELLIEKLVEPAVLEQIQKVMAESQSGKLLEIKQALPDEIGYGTIKWVMADQKFKMSNPVV
ncbi:MAG: helix-turn-helix domain-containing protein [Ferruginibacter sp.]